MTQAVGFIGAGQLGEPMVKRLLATGHDVRVYARREEVRARLRSHGATVTDSMAQASAGCNVVISCVFSDAQLQQISSGPDGLLAHAEPGTVLVSHTTGRASTLVAMSAARDDLQFVDAPVSGTAQDIANGKLTVLVGGAPSAVERIRHVLGAYAAPLIETDLLGSALKIKLVNNLVFAAHVQILAAATALSTELGVDGDRLLDAVAACSGASRACEYARGYGGIHAMGTSIGPVIRKDVDACAAAADEHGTDLGVLATLIESGPLTFSRARD
jgi:3-hydroxyisobutyrate dehydrogenase-like beta-hydroxyacid dehydrogenase